MGSLNLIHKTYFLLKVTFKNMCTYCCKGISLTIMNEQWGPFQTVFAFASGIFRNDTFIWSFQGILYTNRMARTTVGLVKFYLVYKNKNLKFLCF